MSLRKQILDPLSTLCKIASLAFYDVGSKLSIHNNVIEIHKPDPGFIPGLTGQSLTRFLAGDTKDHISLLNNPLIKVIQWYIFNDGKMFDDRISDCAVVVTSTGCAIGDGTTAIGITPRTSGITSTTSTANTIGIASSSIGSTSPILAPGSPPELSLASPKLSDGKRERKLSLITSPSLAPIPFVPGSSSPVLKIDSGTDKKPHVEIDQKKAIKNIMLFAIEGLTKLKKTYQDGNVTFTIRFIINNLKFALNDKQELFELCNELDDESEDSILNFDKIKGIWDSDMITTVSNHLTMCDKNRNNLSLENKLGQLNLALKDADTKFKKLVVEMNSAL